jgi:undecaprenyl-diphosphatase
MNDLLTSIIIAIVQGFTEWFPISSDGHLMIVEYLINQKPNFTTDVALHFGTLMAVFVYFGREITDIIRDFFSGKWKTENGRIALLIIVGTIPVAIGGLLLKNLVEESYNMLGVAALGFAITGIALLIASLYKQKKTKTFLTLSYFDAFLIGAVQVAALLPGISRSATTLVVAILLGLKIKDAAKFSFLLSIPAIFGANILVMGSKTLPTSLILPTLIAFVVGLFAIFFLFRYAFNKKENLKWFALYTLALAIALGIYLVFF